MEGHPGDGECLFSSMAIGKLCLFKGMPLPPYVSRSSWGSRARMAFLQHVDRLQANGGSVLGVATLDVLVKESTDMEFAEYRRRMAKVEGNDRKTWGGFLEASLMCTHWRCKVAFFVWQETQPVLWSISGDDDVDPKHGHKGCIALLWWGTHYDLLRLSPDLLRLVL
jgi:hypothetical protein